MHRILESALDFVFPKRCALCDLLGDAAICQICFESFFEDTEDAPEIPGIRSSSSLFQYHSRAAQAVKRLKYERATSLAEPMSRLLAQYAEMSIACEADLVIPVPIHWSRRCARGFNQSELLCEHLTHAPVERNLLVRKIATRPQVGLSEEERKNNLRGAFQTKWKLSGQSILLVDDVTTSGQTAAECAQTLLEAGASQVSLLTFARG